MVDHWSLSFLLSRVRFAFGNLTLAVLLVTMGPSLGNELVENHSVAPHTAGTSVTEPFMGELNRLVRTRNACSIKPVVTTQGHVPGAWCNVCSAHEGHSLANGLLAPLRC